jgi:hypothetical protein
LNRQIPYLVFILFYFIYFLKL